MPCETCKEIQEKQEYIRNEMRRHLIKDHGVDPGE